MIIFVENHDLRRSQGLPDLTLPLNIRTVGRIIIRHHVARHLRRMGTTLWVGGVVLFRRADLPKSKTTRYDKRDAMGIQKTNVDGFCHSDRERSDLGEDFKKKVWIMMQPNAGGEQPLSVSVLARWHEGVSHLTTGGPDSTPVCQTAFDCFTLGLVAHAFPSSQDRSRQN